jgi:hypothetical protein
VDTPTIDLAASTPEALVGATAWPARPASITSFQAPYGQAQSLVLVPAQFMGSPTGGTGTQRLYNALGVKVYYAPTANTDFDPATILSTEGTASGSDVTFEVTTKDAGGTVTRVLVAFHDFDGTWKFVDLGHGAGDQWSGTTTASRAFADGEQVEYFVQVLDGAANVAFASNKAQNYAAGILDTAPPTITAAVTPAATASGWIAAPSAIVSFTCADADSGIAAGACPTPVRVTTDGVSEVTGTVIDQAGNTATTVATVKLDGSAPTITASVMPNGWSNAASATVTFACSDAASGIDATGCPAPVTVTAEGATNVMRTVHDVAGNAASATGTARLDRTAPTVTITGAAGAVHTCSTTDPLSGVATAATPSNTTTSVNGIPTTTIICSGATDNAGNVAQTVTQTYVAPITFVGFLDPVNNPPTPNTGSAGKTYPIKFQLKTPQGAFITVTPAITSTVYKIGASCSGLGDALESQSSGNSQLTFDAATNTFQYNWKTPSQKGCYEFRLTLADGTTKIALFSLK